MIANQRFSCGLGEWYICGGWCIWTWQIVKYRVA
ncbi:Protein of unknown function [Gryllus bimaculatus]|nr:Protein of unknown function [Gryllus bimaculatus]